MRNTKNIFITKAFVKFVKLLIIFIVFLFFFSLKIEAGCSGGDGCYCGAGCSEDSDCHGEGCRHEAGDGGVWWCTCYEKCGVTGDCGGTWYFCTDEDTPSGCSCFLPNTKISTPGGEKNIQDLKKGDEVKSFDVEKNKETKSIVEKIYETTRSAYYKIKLKDGTELKVTGEHPLYAIQKKDQPLTFWQYLKTESLIKKVVDWIGQNTYDKLKIR